MQLNRQNLAVRHAITKQESRYTLSALQVSHRGRKTVTRATNGHILAEVTTEDVDIEEMATPEVCHGEPPKTAQMLSADNAKILRSVMPAKPQYVIQQTAPVVEKDGKVVAVLAHDLVNTLSFTLSPDGNFPTADLVFSIEKETPIAEFAMGIEVLETALKVIKDFTVDRMARIVFRVYGCDRQIIVAVQSNENTLRMAAMTMRHDNREDILEREQTIQAVLNPTTPNSELAETKEDK